MGFLSLTRNATEKVTCPICGKEHEVKVHYGTQRYLDTTIQIPIRQRLQEYALCECGMLCFNSANEIYRPENLVQSPIYQDILHRQDISEEERKLILLEQGLHVQFGRMMLIHYYYQAHNEEKRQHWIQYTLTKLKNNQDKCGSRYTTQHFPALHQKQTFQSLWFYRPEDKMLDLYRQLGDFASAQSLLNSLQEKYHGDTVALHFLDIERKLIDASDNTPH